MPLSQHVVQGHPAIFENQLGITRQPFPDLVVDSSDGKAREIRNPRKVAGNDKGGHSLGERDFLIASSTNNVQMGDESVRDKLFGAIQYRIVSIANTGELHPALGIKAGHDEV